jgi:hypothetical protein
MPSPEHNLLRTQTQYPRYPLKLSFSIF